MSGDDFFDKKTRISQVIDPVAEEGGVHTADPEVRRLLGHVLRELRAIHWHLANMTGNDPEEIRRDS